MIWIVLAAAILLVIIVALVVASWRELDEWDGKADPPGLAPARNQHLARSPENLGIPDGW